MNRTEDRGQRGGGDIGLDWLGQVIEIEIEIEIEIGIAIEIETT